MKRSEDRILTTHGGNLPRPADLDKLIADGESKRAEIDARVPGAVAEVVDKQIECGVTILNDGEYVKAAHGADYVGGPVRPGFCTPGAPPEPETEKVATSAVRYTGQDAIARDVEAMLEAVEGRDDVQGFIAALGPLSLGAGARNGFHDSEEEYMIAVAEVMREEYKAVTDAGLVLQVDEPEFATTWMFYPEWSIEDYRRYLEFAVEVINHSIAGLPEDLIRFHVCWGRGHRPHTNDVPLKDIADIMMKINAIAYAVESSNVRHQHEWKVWEDVKLADGNTLVPGVIGHYTDLVEHPEVIAGRLVEFASVVGKENLQAGTDCGIGSRVGHAEVVWAKLAAMAQGADLASKQLWKR
ncbi:MAG TPA: hypothetical protein VH573_13350 [Mycobacteriales bacterium]